MMEKNEIKKALYRQKPTAHFVMARKTGLRYQAFLEEEMCTVSFEVPMFDMGSVDWYPEMNAQLLIRWLID